MGLSKTRLKKKLFKKAKEVLPDSTVMKIQRHRLEKTGITSPKPGSYAPSSNYAVVSAIYNVAPYLDDFFDSLMSQTINPAALRIIVVDDGSTDSSLVTVRSWQKKFPGRIECLSKANGGQASARNLGMTMTGDSEWVTFIDPDDFVACDYFEQVDKVAFKYSNLKMISCKTVFYREKARRFEDSHPLNYRFGNVDRIYNVQDDNHPIQLSMSAAFFKMSEINKTNLRINSEIKPNFEDGNFAGRYTINLHEGIIAFCSKPKYYYRKRELGGSTLDKSWTNNDDKITTVVEKGYLDLLLYAKATKGHIPLYIQNTVLYDLSWYFKYFVEHPERSFAYEGRNSVDYFFSTLEKIVSMIDLRAIERVPGAWLRYEWKKAIADKYKGGITVDHIAYIERIEPESGHLLLRTVDPEMKLFFNGKEILPFEKKRREVTFFGRHFLSLHYFWFRFANQSGILSYRSSENKRAILSMRGKHYPDSVDMSTLIKGFTANWSRYPRNNTWIIMDRDTQADDNAEHFYRYMMREHPEQKCYFALRKTSVDWNRLEREGFALLDFGSKEHESALKQCSKIISSHADGFVHSYFKDNFYQSKDFIFLQHGVTKNDLSSWLNGKPISLFCTSTEQEYLSICEDGSPYQFTPRQTALTGFPRHDALLKKADAKQDTILVMPTWRRSLAGDTNGKGNIREIHPEFANSEYKIAWENFLNSERLKAISDKTGARIVFYPHANFAPYLENGFFTLPSYVEIASNAAGNSIQDLFGRAKVAITDYSSIAFDVAYLKKTCLYYQFDKEDFFSGMQVYAKGYFDDERDGFGPVAYTEADLLNELEALASCDFQPQEPYKSRIENTFPFRDGRCCERVYEAIKKLDDIPN